MIKKFRAVFAAIVAVGMSLILYPYFNEYMMKPLYQTAQTLVPGMGDLNDFIWRFLPYGILFFIFFAGVMIALGKVKALGGGGDEEDNSDGD